MIPKLHNKGTSFKGAAAYLLHDTGRATTSERVAWASAVNLAVNNPDMAWRIMAATALDQTRLKEEAGIKSTGRKSKTSVLHLSLSWSPDEADTLDRKEMMRAARGAMKAIGAEDRQALVISHTDGAHPHVHILINRVSPEDGRMLSSSNDRLKLSRWAQAYEEERGHIYCEERVLNNEARDQGEYARGEKDHPRALHERKKDVEAAQDLIAAQRRADAALSRSSREMRGRHSKELGALHEAHSARKRHIKDEAKREAKIRAGDIRARFKPERRALLQKHRQQLDSFLEAERSIFGQVANAFRAVDLKALVSGQESRQTLREAFQVFTGSGARYEVLQRRQSAEKDRLRSQQKRAEKSAIREIRDQGRDQLAEARAQFLAARADLVLKHRMDRAAMKAKWQKRAEDRRAAWREHDIARLLQQRRTQAKAKYDDGHLAAQFDRAQAQDTARDTSGSDKPHDPNARAQEIARVAKQARKSGRDIEQDR